MFIQGQTHLSIAKASARNILIFDLKDSASERTSEDTKLNLVPEPVYLIKSMHCFHPRDQLLNHASSKAAEWGKSFRKLLPLPPSPSGFSDRISTSALTITKTVDNYIIAVSRKTLNGISCKSEMR